MSNRASPPPAGFSTASVSIEDLDAAIGRLARTMNAATYELLVLVREFDERRGWSKWSFASGAEWVAWRCGIHISTAREKLRVAYALRSLPCIADAFAAGNIPYAKVRALTRVATAADEALLLAYAEQATAAQVQERCRQIANVGSGATDAARGAWERRSLSISRRRERGTLMLVGELPAELGEVLLKALDRAVAAGEAAAGPEFAASSWHAQQADAIVAVARSYLSAETERGAGAEDGAGVAGQGMRRVKPVPAADHYQVVVHVDASALAKGGGRSDLPLETVRRLACDGSLMTVLEDERGTPLDVGRKKRVVTSSIRRALWARDRGCVFPGCGRTHYVDAHHVRHWADGGETSVDNTLLLCSHHHTLVHEGGYRVRRDAAGGPYFERPDGRVIPRCGYRLGDVASAPVVHADASADARLGALVRRGRPPNRVREPPPPPY